MSEGTLMQVLAGEATWCVIEGDCLEVLPTIPDRAVAHVITDPPYSARVHARLGKEGRGDEYEARAELSFAHLANPEGLVGVLGRVAARWILAFGDEFTTADMSRSPAVEWVRKGFWVKPDAMPQMSGDRPGSGVEEIAIMHALRAKGSGRLRWNGGGKCAIYSHNTERGDARFHATQKPVTLMLELVSLFTDPDELVMDPFCGSGTTGVACLRLGRRFIGIEKDAKYAAIARERLRAEANGLSLRDARAGQLPMFGES